jgi:16S rRNA processing protein RimM
MARVLRPWGRRGAVSVLLSTDRPEERFAPESVLEARRDKPLGRLTVEWWRAHRSGAVLKFEEIEDIEGAETLRGARLGLPRGEADPLEPDRLLLDDLVGLKVVDPEGAALGRVSGVREAGAQVLLVVATPGGESLVPFHPDLCPTVDLEAGRLVLDAPEGLLDPAEAVEVR